MSCCPRFSSFNLNILVTNNLTLPVNPAFSDFVCNFKFQVHGKIKTLKVEQGQPMYIRSTKWKDAEEQPFMFVLHLEWEMSIKNGQGCIKMIEQNSKQLQITGEPREMEALICQTCNNNQSQQWQMGNRVIDSLVLRSQSLMTKIMVGKQDDIIEHIESEKIECEQSLNQVGDTIGHYAAYRGLLKVLAYLIKRGDTFDVRNNRGLTAIDVALPSVREWLYKNRKRASDDLNFKPRKDYDVKARDGWFDRINKIAALFNIC